MEKKQKKNNIAHLTSILAILGLIVCLVVVYFVGVAVKNKSEKAKMPEEIVPTESIPEDGSEDMQLQLDEVQKYLAQLQDAVTDSTLALNTLTKKDPENDVTDLEAKLKEIAAQIGKTKEQVSSLTTTLETTRNYDSAVITQSLLDVYKRVNEIDEALKNTVTTLGDIQSDSADRLWEIAHNLDVSIQKTTAENHTDFNKLYQDLDKAVSALKQDNEGMGNELSVKYDALGNTINVKYNALGESIDGKYNALGESIDGKYAALGESIDGKYAALGEDITGKYSALGADITGKYDLLGNELKGKYDALGNEINGKYDALGNSIDQKYSELQTNIENNYNSLGQSLKDNMGGRFDALDSKLDLVFQSVADGKKKMASALATVGTKTGMDAQNKPIIMDFGILADKISHSQDISGTYSKEGTEISLEGASNDNLPRGKAAWVGGNYVVGNGADIDNSYNNGRSEGYSTGYEDGYRQGYSEGLSQVYNAAVNYQYHSHTTSDGTVRSADYHSEVPDGCFCKPVYKTVEKTVESEGCKCTSDNVHWTVHSEDGCAVHGVPAGSVCEFLVCDECGHADHRGGVCGDGRGEPETTYEEVIDYYECGCGMTESTIIGATLDFSGVGNQ